MPNEDYRKPIICDLLIWATVPIESKVPDNVPDVSVQSDLSDAIVMVGLKNKKKKVV